MTTKTVMMTGAAVAALAAGAMIAPAAMAEPIPVAYSYADLLEPVPDAIARIHADNATGMDDAHLIPAQIAIGIGVPHHHHHHHHHHHSGRWYRAHGYYWNGQVWMQGPPPYHHHHHHHHHHHNWR